jgi:protein-S-isoprenylcysteine O-methyltransferase Ste14
MKWALINLIGIILTALSWGWSFSNKNSPTLQLILAVSFTLLLIPIFLFARWLLDIQPTLEQAHLVTNAVHYCVIIFLGSAIIQAAGFSEADFSLPIRISPIFGLSIMFISSILLVLIVLNLALKGLGAPIAIALTRQIALEWFYAWTRNPMILSGLILLIGFGLWRQSGLFTAWVVVVVTPVVFVFIRIFEERELEIRFGKDYLEYRDKTPVLIPRKPRQPGA